MSKIIFQLPADGERTVEVRPGETMTVGREAGNTVRLDDDTISRRHARVTWNDDGACVLEDLQSANGTALNGVRIDKATPQDGDRLQFGAVTARFQIADEEAARLTPSEPAPGEGFAACYRLERGLGETATYSAYLATDLLSPDSRNLSLKIFHPGFIEQMGGYETAAKKFSRLRETPPHPNLAQVQEFGRWRGRIYLATQWTEGYELLDLLCRRGELTPPEAVRLARQAAGATDHCREHRLPAPDLSPRSVIVSFDEPLPAAAWAVLLDRPVKDWPQFALKTSPSLFAPSQRPTLSALGAFLYELLGHPQAAPGMLTPPPVASLSEVGNAILVRGAPHLQGTYASDAAFLDALAQAEGLQPA